MNIPPYPRAMTSGAKKLAGPAFAGDDGAPDLALRAELAAPTESLIELLRSARLLVAVVAVPEELGVAGADKRTHLAAVSMINASGAKGLLAFTGLDSLTRWDPIARPVPVLGAQAAGAAIADGSVALVIDIAGPHRYVVTSTALTSLAAAD